jgi:nickel-type superoxide dismutase maturation protease
VCFDTASIGLVPGAARILRDRIVDEFRGVAYELGRLMSSGRSRDRNFMDKLPEADWFEKTAYFLGWREIWKIEGNSMFPTLRDGDTVIVNPHDKIRVGDLIVAKHPFKMSVTFVKRVAEITGDGRYFVVGDNALESEDSRSFGAVTPAAVIGRVTCIFDLKS